MQQDIEFVSAKSAKQILLPEGTLHPVCCLFQQFISCHMPICVIHLLEIIHIKENKRHIDILWAGQHIFGSPLKCLFIQQTCQSIRLWLLLQCCPQALSLLHMLLIFLCLVIHIIKDRRKHDHSPSRETHLDHCLKHHIYNDQRHRWYNNGRLHHRIFLCITDGENYHQKQIKNRNDLGRIT